MKEVAVIYGGISAERDVSLISGKAYAAALVEAGYKVREIDVGANPARLIQALTPPPDVVLNALHGRYGEDGCVQAILELLKIPYTHSGVLASALAMDKPMARSLFTSIGLKCAEGCVVERKSLLQADPLPRPYVIKPLHEGSSVGVEIVTQDTNLHISDNNSWSYGEKVLVEKFIPGRELTVGVMGDKPLAVTEITPKIGFYDYTAKYQEGKTLHSVPADIALDVYELAMEQARKAHDVLGCRGVSRADFRFDETQGLKGLYILEVNTQPGMTPLSLVPEQAIYRGFTFVELVSWIVEQAQCDT